MQFNIYIYKSNPSKLIILRNTNTPPFQKHSIYPLTNKFLYISLSILSHSNNYSSALSNNYLLNHFKFIFPYNYF